MNFAVTFRLDQWSIVPGPPSIRPPYQSTHLDAIAAYSPRFVAQKLLAIPGSASIHPAEPDWWSWVARWSSNSGHVDLTMTLFDAQPVRWGGFTLAGTAGPHALLDLYTQLHAALPATWLHNADSELHTAESFRSAILAT